MCYRGCRISKCQHKGFSSQILYLKNTYQDTISTVHVHVTSPALASGFRLLSVLTAGLANLHIKRSKQLLKATRCRDFRWFCLCATRSNCETCLIRLKEITQRMSAYRLLICRLQNSRFWKAGSAVSVILECESLTILPRCFFTRSRPFVPIWSVAHVRKKNGCFAV